MGSPAGKSNAPTDLFLYTIMQMLILPGVLDPIFEISLSLTNHI